MGNRNPHNICTWNDQAECQNCSIQGELHCKWDRKLLNGFYATSLPPLIIAIFGMVLIGILTGVWWTLITYVIYVPIMLGVFETGFLCSHCPYYSEDSKILHCLANHGNPKIWPYRPGPLNRLEKLMMVFLVVGMVFFFAPLAVEGYGIWFVAVKYAEYGLVTLLGFVGITVASFAVGVSFISVVRIFFCTRCVNFSCPLNTVSKPAIDEYLKKNLVIRKAWEKSGWQMD